jgi:hypothetical protein
MSVRRLTLGLVPALCVLVGALVLIAAPAFALNPERHYELVSPIYKGGSGVGNIEAVGQSGESVAYFAPAAFSGAPLGLTQNINPLDYLSSRGVSGWSTAPIMPPATLLPGVPKEDSDISRDMGVTIALGKRAPNVEAAEQQGTEGEFLVHETGLPDISSDWDLAGKVVTRLNGQPLRLRYLGASPDFCHLLFGEYSDENYEPVFGTEALLEGAENAVHQLYELSSGCGGESVALRLVAVKNSGEIISPGCPPNLGIEEFGEPASVALHAYNAIAADGDTIFFTACIENDRFDHQLFVRLGGSRTIEVSRPMAEHCGEEIPCGQAANRANANFAGASEDGSKVFFTTAAPLDPATDTDSGSDLYMATIGCPSGDGCDVSERGVTSLVQVSHDPNNGAADVQGVVRVAPDGSRVYFVAEGDLLPGAEQLTLEGERRRVPQPGADNLYEYDSVSGAVQFVGDLCSGYRASGLVEDSRCPNEESGVDTALWLSPGGTSEAQTAGVDGRYLLFTSYGQLTNDDTDAARDVYRFDAVTGTLERISIGENGFDANGNNSGVSGDGEAVNASIVAGHFGGSIKWQYDMDNRAISEDGSRIVFSTAGALSSGATNGLANVYEWHENASGDGSVTLLSGGASSTAVEDAVMAPSGNDVFFVTSEGLVAQDVDGAADIYDARLGSGFTAPPAPPEPCSGDACQGPLTNPAPLLVPGSVSQAAGGNLSPPITPAKVVTPKKATAKCSKDKKLKRSKCVKQKKSKVNKKTKQANRRTSR